MKYIQLLLAVLLFICLLKMPYGYYMFIRFIGMVFFAIFAYQYSKREQQILAVVFGSLSLLFQPFIKIALGRTIWNIVDLLVAIFLLGIFFFELGKNK
ncbi:DUF6804 family protein [Hoylesella saccharolytica]|uniref:DUF6804 family protein n=1 Tax=Hoylesella saccharolytica TaxID=633701 RepID=UPI0028D894F4|nr:DUF6804 family protein [Hoylesella saccharolytica]